MRSRKRRFFAPSLVALLLLTSNCMGGGTTDASSTPSTGLVDKVVVSPAGTNIIVTFGVALSADVQFKPGKTGTRDVTWSSSDPSVADVDAAGLVTGKSPGSATIKASSNADHAVEGVATIGVSSLVVSVFPEAPTLEVGQGEQFSCVVTAALGFTVPPHMTVDWFTDDRTIASVETATGGLTALKAGTTAVKCEVFGRSIFTGQTPVTVTQPSLTLKAYPDVITQEMLQHTKIGVIATAHGIILYPPPQFLFISGNDGIATVGADGDVIGRSIGITGVTISAIGFLRTGLRAVTAPITVPVTILAATTPPIVISPNPANLAINATTQLSATVNGAAPTNPVGWNSTDVTAATVTLAGGLVTGVAGGATIVRGTFNVSNGGGTTIYSRATVVNVTAPPQACAASGTYTFVRTPESDEANSQNLFINLPDPLPLTFTITGSSFTVTGPAPFIGGTGTINGGCNISMTATSTLYGIPNVDAILSGALPATGATRLVYQLGSNGSLPRGFPVYYRLTK